MYERAPAHSRFWAKVDRDGPLSKYRPDLGPCWIWTGAKSGERGTPLYGAFVWDRKTGGAHRFSYEQEHGQIPDGLEPDHLCKNTLCVRPSHLEIVTRQENQKRSNSVSGLNARKTHCPRGHSLVDAYRHCGRRVCRICHRMKTARQKKHGGLS